MAKKRRLITRRRLKWVGTGALVVLLVVMFASMWRAPALSRWVSQTHYLISIERGRLSFESDTLFTTELGRRWAERTVDPFSPGIDFAPDWGSMQLGNTGTNTFPFLEIRYVFIPIWPILLLIAGPTAWLWRTDRRAKPWQCAKCRYDLRGLKPKPKADSSESYPTKAAALSGRSTPSARTSESEPTICPECGTRREREL